MQRDGSRPGGYDLRSMVHQMQANRSPDPITFRTVRPGVDARAVRLLVLLACLTCLVSGCVAVDPARDQGVAPATPVPVLAAQYAVAATASAEAAPSSPCSPTALVAMRHRTPVAAYGDHRLALVSGTVYAWRGAAHARLLWRGAVQVAAGPTQAFALDGRRRVLVWQIGSDQAEVWLDDTVWIAAGPAGLLAIRCDGSLWERTDAEQAWTQIADAAVHAASGEGTDYYVDAAGGLFARGQARRGQYGDGRLTAQEGWTRVADDAVAVVAHTGHALYQRADGTVLGTGGNRFGPLGVHGFGDKADNWGFMFASASRIATGSRHSMAIRADGSLWVWGQREGFLPKRVLEHVVASSGDAGESVALTADGAIWQWSFGASPKRLDLPAAP